MHAYSAVGYMYPDSMFVACTHEPAREQTNCPAKHSSAAAYAHTCLLRNAERTNWTAQAISRKRAPPPSRPSALSRKFDNWAVVCACAARSAQDGSVTQQGLLVGLTCGALATVLERKPVVLPMACAGRCDARALQTYATIGPNRRACTARASCTQGNTLLQTRPRGVQFAS